MGWLQRLSDGLTKTRDAVRGSLDRLLGRAADPLILEEFEAALMASDLGARVVERVMERLKKQLQGTDASQPGRVHAVLRETLLEVLTPVQGLSLEPLLTNGLGLFASSSSNDSPCTGVNASSNVSRKTVCTRPGCEASVP